MRRRGARNCISGKLSMKVSLLAAAHTAVVRRCRALSPRPGSGYIATSRHTRILSRAPAREAQFLRHALRGHIRRVHHRVQYGESVARESIGHDYARRLGGKATPMKRRGKHVRQLGSERRVFERGRDDTRPTRKLARRNPRSAGAERTFGNK